MKARHVLPFLFIFVLSSPVSAQDFQVLSLDELKEAIDKRVGMVIVDARTVQEYDEGHIPGAINIAPDKLNSIETLLPKNKDTLIVFYCRGTG